MTPSSLLITSCFALCFFSLWFSYKNKNLLAGTSKVLASTCFVGLVWQLGLVPLYPFLITGLICCFFGDALLVASGKGKLFLFGLGFFLLGHVFYVIALLNLDLNYQLSLWGLILVIWPAFKISVLLAEKLPQFLKYCVQLYLFIISIMMTLSCGALDISKDSWLVAFGALLFAASDVFVAINRFKRPAFINRLIGLPLYYLAQILIILGFYKML